MGPSTVKFKIVSGSLVHNGQLVIPYGISDNATTFATLPLDQVLAAME